MCVCDDGEGHFLFGNGGGAVFNCKRLETIAGEIVDATKAMINEIVWITGETIITLSGFS